MTPFRVTLAIAGLAGVACGQTDWPTFGHDLGGSRYFTLKQIDTANVTKLVRAWTYHMNAAAPQAPAAGSSEAGDAVQGGRGRGGRGGRGGNSEVSPLVIDGVMYLTTGGGKVIALEPETSKEI